MLRAHLSAVSYLISAKKGLNFAATRLKVSCRK